MPWLAGAAVFLAATLLFLIQPILAKLILPAFGGAAGVWAVCLFFFQALLLAGYAYAHALIRFVPSRLQGLVHAGLLGLSLLALPVAIPNLQTLPENPMMAILVALAAAIAAPYVLLASTSPLMQAWLARAGSVPYRLFAVSNLASLAGLLAYPFVVEPISSARQQTAAWSIAYVLFAALAAAIGWRSGRAPSMVSADTGEFAETPTITRHIQWLILAALPSALLVAFTNHITQDVASLPFLWILPLSVYLLTFILCFDRDATARWPFWNWVAGLSLMVASVAQVITEAPARLVIPLFLGTLFLIVMYFHGKLVVLKPPSRHLTSFYLMISLGGALGSMAVSLVAPSAFSSFLELPFALVASSVALLYFEYGGGIAARLRWFMVIAATVLTARFWIYAVELNSIAIGRNFYGVLTVQKYELAPGTGPANVLVHGTIRHGAQLLSQVEKPQAITYYAPQSGIGLAMAARPHPRYGVVGLGTGSLAALANPRDFLRYYEINGLDIDYARRYFTFLDKSPGKVEVALGDARLTMLSESPNNYDVLAIDAFSGDAIPVHLLTRECFTIYQKHLAPQGMLVFHVTNTHLDLAPVVAAAARTIGLEPRVVNYVAPKNTAFYSSKWVIAARPETWNALGPLKQASAPLPAASGKLWTDDYSNLLGVLR